jgi:hypothetical protein
MNPWLVAGFHAESASLLSGLRSETGSLLILGLTLYVVASFAKRRPITPDADAAVRSGSSAGQGGLRAAA